MSDIVEVTGMVLSAMPVGEYDRRIVLLTKERGKISAFAKGARRPNSPLLGVTRAFVFGTFSLYEGRTTYNVKQADIRNFFEDILLDYDAVCYGCYFAELADYYGREGVDASTDVNLMYMALRALLNEHIPNTLVRRIYELRLIAHNGELCNMYTCHDCGSDEDINTFAVDKDGVLCKMCGKNSRAAIPICSSTLYALQFIISQPLERLFTFNVSRDVLDEITRVADAICHNTFDRTMKSLEMIDK